MLWVLLVLVIASALIPGPFRALNRYAVVAVAIVFALSYLWPWVRTLLDRRRRG